MSLPSLVTQESGAPQQKVRLETVERNGRPVDITVASQVSARAFSGAPCALRNADTGRRLPASLVEPCRRLPARATSDMHPFSYPCLSSPPARLPSLSPWRPAMWH